MQTLAFLWYELKAAKRHVKEEVAEPQQFGKTDFSLLTRAPESQVTHEPVQSRWHLWLGWMVKKKEKFPSRLPSQCRSLRT